MKISSLSCPLCNLDFGAFWIRDVQPAKKLLKNKQMCILPAVSRFHLYWKAITSGSVPCAWILRMHLPCVPHPQFFSRSLRNVWLGKPLISPASSPYDLSFPSGLLEVCCANWMWLEALCEILEPLAHRHCSLSLASAVVCSVFTSDSRLETPHPNPSQWHTSSFGSS